MRIDESALPERRELARHRQREGEDRALSWLALDPNATAVGFDQVLGDVDSHSWHVGLADVPCLTRLRL